MPLPLSAFPLALNGYYVHPERLGALDHRIVKAENPLRAETCVPFHDLDLLIALATDFVDEVEFGGVWL